jgi:hypothetical protein
VTAAYCRYRLADFPARKHVTSRYLRRSSRIFRQHASKVRLLIAARAGIA